LTAPPQQGDVVWADPDPTRGSEQAKARPWVVVSIDAMNRAPLGASIVVPLTRSDLGSPLHVRIDPPEGGIEEISFALPEQLRVLAHERIARRVGAIKPQTLQRLLAHCRLLLGDPQRS
jgi:mRNA interferase MazF